MRPIIAVLAATAVLAPAPAMAWGNEGHETIALIARSYLTPDVRAKVDAILASDPGGNCIEVTLGAPPLSTFAPIGTPGSFRRWCAASTTRAGRCWLPDQDSLGLGYQVSAVVRALASQAVAFQ